MSTFIPPTGQEPKIVVAGDPQAVVPKASALQPLVVTISHEPFLDWYMLEYNGQTEELDHMECLDWFKAHGAKNMDAVNDAINQAFNFHHAEVVIGSPISPGVLNDKSRYNPKI